jgi:hypothetical protein
MSSEEPDRVEELHVYEDGRGTSAMALPPEIDWVSLSPTEAAAYRELRFLLGDLDFSISVLTRLLDDWTSGDFITGIRDLDSDDRRARWTAALVAYARTFLGRVGARLDPGMFQGDAAQQHAFFIGLRNRHVAHSVSEFEHVAVVIGLDRGEPVTVNGLVDSFSTEQSPGKDGVEGLLRLATFARDEVRTRLRAERKRLLEYARLTVGDLGSRPRISEIPARRYRRGIKVRRK